MKIGAIVEILVFVASLALGYAAWLGTRVILSAIPQLASFTVTMEWWSQPMPLVDYAAQSAGTLVGCIVLILGTCIVLMGSKD